MTRPKSIREIATLLGHKGSGSARATLQRDLESGLEKLWQGLAAEVGFAGAARAVWQLIRTDPTFDPPKWLVEKLRRFRSELEAEVVEVSPPPALEGVRWWTAQKSTMSEKVFERELRAKGRVL